MSKMIAVCKLLGVQMNYCRHKIYMRCVVLSLAIVSAATLPKVCCGQATDQEPQNHFQRELSKRVNRDQATRKAIIRFQSQTKNKKANEAEQKRYMKLLKKASDTDQSNLTWQKKLIAIHGFPSYSELGVRSAEEFFLLILHADRDRKFQKRCLKYLEEVKLGWPEKYLQLLQLRLKQPLPPTIKLTDTRLKRLVPPTIETPDPSSDKEEGTVKDELPDNDERPEEVSEED